MRLKAVCMAQQCSHGIQPRGWSFARVSARVCRTSLCRTPVDFRAASQSGAFVWVCVEGKGGGLPSCSRQRFGVLGAAVS